MGNKRHRKAPKRESSPTPEDIPEDEQWRLVNDSGILKDYDGPQARVLHRDPDNISSENQNSGDLADRIFDAILLIIPLTFMYLLMDM
jgi:hypothetical protein